jgi:preprotein translocase subunit YajC
VNIEDLCVGDFLKKISGGEQVFCAGGPGGTIKSISNGTFKIILEIIVPSVKTVLHEIDKKSGIFQFNADEGPAIIITAPNKEVTIIYPQKAE